MDLETVNKLYLELSQFATAKTKADIELEYQRKKCDRRWKLIRDIFNCDEAENLPSCLKSRIEKELNPGRGVIES